MRCSSFESLEYTTRCFLRPESFEDQRQNTHGTSVDGHNAMVDCTRKLMMLACDNNRRVAELSDDRSRPSLTCSAAQSMVSMIAELVYRGEPEEQMTRGIVRSIAGLDREGLLAEN